MASRLRTRIFETSIFACWITNLRHKPETSATNYSFCISLSVPNVERYFKWELRTFWVLLFETSSTLSQMLLLGGIFQSQFWIICKKEFVRVSIWTQNQPVDVLLHSERCRHHLCCTQTSIKAGMLAIERTTSVAAKGSIKSVLYSTEFRVFKSLIVWHTHYISIDDIVTIRQHHKHFINLFVPSEVNNVDGQTGSYSLHILR